MNQTQAEAEILRLGEEMRLLVGIGNHLLLEWGSYVPGSFGTIYCSGPGTLVTKQAVTVKAKAVRNILYGFIDEFPCILANVRVKWGPDVVAPPAEATTIIPPLPPICTICQGKEYYV
jgi:hypothetical protein